MFEMQAQTFFPLLITTKELFLCSVSTVSCDVSAVFTGSKCRKIHKKQRSMMLLKRKENDKNKTVDHNQNPVNATWTNY